MKFLLTGDVNGKLSVLETRVSKLNQSKHGPFDAVLCVGNFFQSTKDDNEEDVDNFFSKTVTDFILPLYFIGGVNDFKGKYSKLIVNQDKIELCKNITFLGTSGVHYINNISVAYLSANASLRDVDNLMSKQTKDGKPIDFLLTHTWALSVDDMTHLLTKPNTGGVKVENNLVKSLVSSSSATYRYHIAGCKNRFLKFPPYRNGTSNYTTRFIGLGNVGEKDKSKKWLHALTLAPLTAAPLPPPANLPVVNNPYIMLKNSKSNSNAINIGDKRPPLLLPLKFTAADAARLEQNQGNNFNRFGRNNNKNNNPNKNQMQHPNKRRRFNKVPSRQDCWFCLASPTCEKHLIVSVASEMYLCLPKGGISAGHLLIVPISHEESMAHASNTMIEETNKYKLALKEFYRSHNEKCISIERCVTTKGPQHHTYIEIIPVPNSFAQSVETVFLSECIRCDLKFQLVKPGEPLDGYIPEDKQYIYIELCDGQRFIHCILDERRNAGTIPLQFGRQIIAKALSCPERTNWKNCVVPQAQETQLASGFKGVFNKFDWTLK
jgi:hypothetical protein